MTSPDSLSLRFEAGRFEPQLLVAILAVQATLVVMIGLGAVAFIYITIGDFVESRPLFSQAWLLPVVLAGGLAAIGLGRLYD